MDRKVFVGLALAALIATSAVVRAEVTWTPEDGGFVGKGDVQTLFGWNNATMQANHTSIEFELVMQAGYTFECEWWTGPSHNRRHHTNTKEIELDINATVESSSRRTGQYTGWNLGPASGDAVSIDEPTDADCGAEGNDMKSIVPGSVEAVVEDGGGLYAVFNGDRRLLLAF